MTDLSMKGKRTIEEPDDFPYEPIRSPPKVTRVQQSEAEQQVAQFLKRTKMADKLFAEIVYSRFGSIEVPTRVILRRI